MKKLLIGLCILVAGMFSACEVIADEGDVLPNDQQACYETAPTVNRMELVVPEQPKKPDVNYDSHYLNNEYGRKLSALSFITPKTVVIKLFSGISVADFVKIHDDFRKLKDYTDFRDVTLVINSPGGSAFDGLSIASLILSYRDAGFTIRAQGFGIIASAAVPILSVCSPRYVAPGTLIMVHEAALWKWPGRETQSDIKSQDYLMTLLNDRYVSFLVENTTTTDADWRKMIKATTWMTPEKAKTLGLVDEVK
jgi:ATP-dependent protease ClpP protease subunit